MGGRTTGTYKHDAECGVGVQIHIQFCVNFKRREVPANCEHRVLAAEVHHKDEAALAGRLFFMMQRTISDRESAPGKH